MKVKKLAAGILCVSMGFSLVACGGGTTSSSTTTAAAPGTTVSSDTTTASAPSESIGSSITLSYNHQMAGDWIAEFVDKEIKSFAVDVMGFGYEDPAFNFDSDQELADCQNLISSGVSGHLYYAAFDTLTPTISDMFKEAKIPFAIPENMPSEESMKVLLDNPYFAGAIFADYYNGAYALGSAAAEKGYKKAIMLVGTIGVWGQDERQKGFSDGFTAGGGEVLEAARINDNSEATQAANDLYAAHSGEADCVYASDPGMLEACFNANSTYNVDLMAFGSDLGANHIQKVRDGKLISDGGHVPLFAVTATLLVNYIDGHPILDEAGKPAVFDNWKFFYIDASNVDDYEEFYLNKTQHISNEDYKSLLYRDNSDVSYADYKTFIENFSLDYVVNNAK